MLTQQIIAPFPSTIVPLFSIQARPTATAVTQQPPRTVVVVITTTVYRCNGQSWASGLFSTITATTQVTGHTRDTLKDDGHFSFFLVVFFFFLFWPENRVRQARPSVVSVCKNGKELTFFSDCHPFSIVVAVKEKPQPQPPSKQVIEKTLGQIEEQQQQQYHREISSILVDRFGAGQKKKKKKKCYLVSLSANA